MLDTNEEIVRYNSDMGNYDYNKKKKKAIYYDEENLSEDTDGDGPDYIERQTGVHDKNNKHVRHFTLGGHLNTNKSGTIVIPHQFLGSIQRKHKSGKMKMTMPTPKKMKLSMEIDSPKMNFSMKQIKIPQAKLDDKRIKTNTGSFETKYLEAFFERVGIKRKKKKGFM
jgi:hypothetical protein